MTTSDKMTPAQLFQRLLPHCYHPDCKSRNVCRHMKLWPMCKYRMSAGGGLK